MKVLVIGNGAREHAIVWKLSQSPKITKIYVAPGNAGTSLIAENVAISCTNIKDLLSFAKDKAIDITFVGPEAPLAGGVVDVFESEGLRIFGPCREAAQLESSKVFTKELLLSNKIPTAYSRSFSSYEKACSYLSRLDMPVVIKADGLAGGKGVTVAQTHEQAMAALSDIMEAKIFGEAGEHVVIEECMVGQEMSFFAVTDGKTVAPLSAACDYKRIYDGDKGANTGGMGSYTPPAFFTPELKEEIMSRILLPVIKALADRDIVYKGVLYAGLMITAEGPKVMEFNARFGDPETQVLMPLLKTDLLEIVEATIEGRLDKLNIEMEDSSAVGVVLASGGYPAEYRKKLPVSGLSDIPSDILVFHAGTVASEEGEILTNGGRVLCLVSKGKNIEEARDNVYKNIDCISFEDCHYRRDIALLNGRELCH
ncbi:phosphoribosylamine--glycine ligase [Dehalococcoides mccartyi]|uniref:phosphoribosylamine--glycine ligase n=1 Tax=Dehalococcoides mccartyi TaxID=61435 RepID=UPI00066233FE